MNFRYTENCFADEPIYELDSVSTDNFERWLIERVGDMSDGNFAVECCGDTFYVLDGCNMRNGEMYQIITE